MHKTLLILGILKRGPMHGYELLQIVRNHGTLYTDLKKANLYYLLKRLADDGALAVTVEEGTRGARGERLIYSLTEAGEKQFDQLMREVLVTYEPGDLGVEVAVVFLSTLSSIEVVSLLEERRLLVEKRRVTVMQEYENVNKQRLLFEMAVGHMIGLIDAELAWINQAIEIIQRSLARGERLMAHFDLDEDSPHGG